MYDNFNRFVVKLNGCSHKTESVDGAVEHSFVSADFENATMVISTADTQGSVEGLIGGNDQYLIVQFMGDLPDISYQYFVDDTEVGEIFSVNILNGLGGTIHFKPVDDFNVSPAVDVLQLAAIIPNVGYNLQNNVNSFESRRFAVQSYYGTDENRVGKNMVETDFIGVVSYLNETRYPICRIKASQASFGSIRKRLVLKLAPNSKIESIVFGTTKLFDAGAGEMKALSSPKSLYDMSSETRYAPYHSNILRFIKVLKNTNRIFNTEVTI